MVRKTLEVLSSVDSATPSRIIPMMACADVPNDSAWQSMKCRVDGFSRIEVGPCESEGGVDRAISVPLSASFWINASKLSCSAIVVIMTTKRDRVNMFLAIFEK